MPWLTQILESELDISLLGKLGERKANKRKEEAGKEEEEKRHFINNSVIPTC